MNTVNLYPVRTLEATHFIEGLAQNVASVIYNLALPEALRGRSLISAISMVAKQNFSPEFNFFASASGISADPQLDSFISMYQIADVTAQQFAGAGLYRYYIDGLAIPYVDLDTQNTVGHPTLHVAMDNRSTTAKSAGSAGYVAVTFWLLPLNE